MSDIVERLRKLNTTAFGRLMDEAADEIEAARRQVDIAQPSGQTRAEIIEECAKVAEAWDGKPCGHAFGWTDDQRDYYDAGQLDASSSIVRAIRALAAQGKQPTGMWPDWGDRPDGFDGPGGAE
jgi:hypothetical protein